jgi:hypothetical protein
MDRRIPLAVALASFAMYTALAVPGVYWLDSSEFAAAAWTLGVAHPPGHPLMSIWSRLFVLLPFGSIGFRVAIGQAVAGALAVGALAVLAREVAQRVGVSERAASLLGGAAGIVFAFTYGLAFHAVRPEVYALSAATTLGAAACALRGRWPAAGLLVGLGLCNHHLLALAGAAPLLGLAIAERRLGARGWALVLAAGTIALGCYLYIPLRAARSPLVDWGHATTLKQFWWVVSARAFQKSVQRAADVPLAFEAMRAIGLPAVLCAFGGLFALLRTRGTRTLAGFLVAEIGFFTAASALVGFDAANPDSHGYLCCAMAFALALAMAFPAMILLAVRSARVGAASAAAVALACVAAQVVHGVGGFSLADAWGADRVLGEVLRELPPRTVLTTDYFQTVFGLWYVQSVEGARPDVAIHHPRFAANPPPSDADRRPARIEVALDTPVDHLTPAGLFYRPGMPVDADFKQQDAIWDRLTADADDPLTQKYLVWEVYLAAELRCRQGQKAEAARALDRAGLLGIGEGPEVTALRARCRP